MTGNSLNGGGDSTLLLLHGRGSLSSCPRCRLLLVHALLLHIAILSRDGHVLGVLLRNHHLLVGVRVVSRCHISVAVVTASGRVHVGGGVHCWLGVAGRLLLVRRIHAGKRSLGDRVCLCLRLRLSRPLLAECLCLLSAAGCPGRETYSTSLI